LAVGLDDAAYARELEGFLTEIGKVTDPELVLYDAGVDVHSRDLLGKLKLTDAGVFERDRVVIEHYLGAGVPLCGVIGGGYSKDIHALADRHAILHRAARFALARLD
jgi:acetoin utilization deacetylase AcuC-like enzyme